MKLKHFLLLFFILTGFGEFQFPQAGYPSGTPNPGDGSYYTGKYKNLFAELLNKTEADVNSKINSAFNLYFYGDNKTQRLYYPVEPGMAYIEDINNRDVRTEGMSYGMMISVQLNKKTEFDRIWKWARTFMQHKSGARKNYFAWHCNTSGKVLDSTAASDGEQWFVMALFFASARWGDGVGIYNYRTEAQKILDAMLHQESRPENDRKIKNMFNKEMKQVVFVPDSEACGFTDPSYHLPHFYELWARWADKDNKFWCSAAAESRKFFKTAVDSVNGLAPDYANFNGSPTYRWNNGAINFRYDAWRVAMNIAIDYLWFAKDPWEVLELNNLQKFFYSEGIEKYGTLFTLKGKVLDETHSTGLVAMNGVASISSDYENRIDFVKELWSISVPTGEFRYYDGMLYMLGMLQVSGNFRIYSPADKPVTNNCEKE
jgi:oligosaccharide reducing-end xylanase